MKKVVFALIAMFIGSMSLSAQKDVKVRFGVEGGFNMTKWNGALLPDYTKGPEEILSGFDDSSIKPGFHVGGLADLMIQDRWSIQPEVLFAMEGSKVALDSTGALTNVSALYIRIPILVYYNFHIGPGQLSPGLGFFFSGGVGGSYIDADGFKQKTFGTHGILDEFDWGLNVKAAYELQKFAPGLFLSVGFSQGFSTSKSTGLSVAVGYKFQYAKVLKRVYNTGMLEYNP